MTCNKKTTYVSVNGRYADSQTPRMADILVSQPPPTGYMRPRFRGRARISAMNARRLFQHRPVSTRSLPILERMAVADALFPVLRLYEADTVARALAILDSLLALLTAVTVGGEEAAPREGGARDITLVGRHDARHSEFHNLTRIALHRSPLTKGFRVGEDRRCFVDAQTYLTCVANLGQRMTPQTQYRCPMYGQVQEARNAVASLDDRRWNLMREENLPHLDYIRRVEFALTRSIDFDAFSTIEINSNALMGRNDTTFTVALLRWSQNARGDDLMALQGSTQGMLAAIHQIQRDVASLVRTDADQGRRSEGPQVEALLLQLQQETLRREAAERRIRELEWEADRQREEQRRLEEQRAPTPMMTVDWETLEPCSSRQADERDRQGGLSEALRLRLKRRGTDVVDVSGSDPVLAATAPKSPVPAPTVIDLAEVPVIDLAEEAPVVEYRNVEDHQCLEVQENGELVIVDMSPVVGEAPSPNGASPGPQVPGQEADEEDEIPEDLRELQAIFDDLLPTDALGIRNPPLELTAEEEQEIMALIVPNDENNNE